jgi:hypothetical protein
MSLLSTALEQGLTPDVIDETNPDDVFLGYFKYNSLTTPSHCAIKRVTKTGGITEIKYPVGRFDFVFDWAGRAGLSYRFRDFTA